jgi:hypothetical protein
MSPIPKSDTSVWNQPNDTTAHSSAPGEACDGGGGLSLNNLGALPPPPLKMSY